MGTTKVPTKGSANGKKLPGQKNGPLSKTIFLKEKMQPPVLKTTNGNGHLHYTF